jgi:hypothetical protein
MLDGSMLHPKYFKSNKKHNLIKYKQVLHLFPVANVMHMSVTAMFLARLAGGCADH